MSAVSIGFIVLCVAAFFTTIISAMLYYHWIRYGVGLIGTVTVMIVYGFGTLILLLSLLGLLVQA